MIAVAEEVPDQADVRLLLAASDRFMERLYPPASNHLLSLSALQGDNVTFPRRWRCTVPPASLRSRRSATTAPIR